MLLAETTPEDVMAYWRGHLADLWPQSGEVALPSETPQPGWAEMLRNVAAHYGERPPVRLRRRLRDRNRRWGRLGNLRHNALIRTSLQRLFHRGAGS